jgi:hypothetical protein
LKDNHNVYIVSIVAIVAIVALVMFFAGGQSTSVSESAELEINSDVLGEDLAGQAVNKAIYNSCKTLCKDYKKYGLSSDSYCLRVCYNDYKTFTMKYAQNKRQKTKPKTLMPKNGALVEVCNDGLDNDLDQSIDCYDQDCECYQDYMDCLGKSGANWENGICVCMNPDQVMTEKGCIEEEISEQETEEICNNWIDDDGDGQFDAGDMDCLCTAFSGDFACNNNIQLQLCQDNNEFVAVANCANCINGTCLGDGAY